MGSQIKTLVGILAGTFLTACGEPAFENAGSQASLIEDREACAAEIEKSPAANAYRQDPDAHPGYPADVFNEMNSCIERKGWKQVQSQQEQEWSREAIASEAANTVPSVLDSMNMESFVRSVERRLGRSPSESENVIRKD